MSVNSHLTNLASSLVISDKENLSIFTSGITLELRLNLYFGNIVTEHFQFGSNTRGTILPRAADRYSDIDYMVVFNTSNSQMKPQTYLNNLKIFVEKKYSKSEIYQSHPTIVLSLNHIKFELVPAINNYGYQIPSSASDWNEWMNTDPSGINQRLQAANKNNNFQIKPLVRLIKYWNKKNGNPFSSFSLEEYIISKLFWGCSTLKDYFYFFWTDFNCQYNTPQYKKNMVDRAKQCIRQARDYENSNMPMTAEVEIKKIVPSL